MSPSFNHFDLYLLNPGFGSELTKLVLELEQLRHQPVRRTTPDYIFQDLKGIIHMLESIGSARIEGNNTTLLDYVDAKAEKTTLTDALQEIANIETALNFLEDAIQKGEVITHVLIRKLHELTVAGLKREGDNTPGEYREENVVINRSDHLPPEHLAVKPYMDELLDFINRRDELQYDLIKISTAHHRFAWIHPFTNGNGRVVRLLTYAMLLSSGFDVASGGRVFNSTAVFCADRDHYYKLLNEADRGDLEAWCVYVLSGFKTSLEKINRLADFDYFKTEIYDFVIVEARRRDILTDIQFRILANAPIDQESFKRNDIVESSRLTESQVTYGLGTLKDEGFIAPLNEHSKQYTVQFSDNRLVRLLVIRLEELGLILSV